MKAMVVLALLRLLAVLPLRLNHSVGDLIGRLYVLIPNRRRRVAQVNVDLCYPDQDEKWRRSVMVDSLKESAKVFTELSPLWYWNQERLMKLVVDVSGETVLEDALAKRTGVIILFPHIGCWEMVNSYVSSRLQVRFTVLFRPEQMEALQPSMQCGRERFGARLVSTDFNGVRALYRALNAGEVIGILPDQEPQRDAGVFAPFFGIPAYTMSLLPRLAQKTRAPVVTAMMERLPAGKGYKLHYLPVSDAIYDENPVVSATAVNDAVQACIA
ncbi:MAG: lysophospholipid acyltransferase family protein, partial [Acidiferrobacterales bacterium]